jgi:LPS-assembly lipoprotein
MSYLPPPVFAGPRVSYNHLPRQRFARRGGRSVSGLIFVLCLALAGCGFRPLYGDARLDPQLSSIYVEPVAERDGYELRNTLINLLGSNGESGGKAYRLRLILNESNQGVALQNDATITRYNDTLTVNYVLSDANGTEITSGNQTSLSSYNVVASPYSTLSAQQDADTRAAQDIAERIRIDLGAFFRRKDGR